MLTGGPQVQGGGAPRNPYSGGWTTASLDQAQRAQAPRSGWTMESLQQAQQAQLNTPAQESWNQVLSQNPLLQGDLLNNQAAQQAIWGQLAQAQGQYAQQAGFLQQNNALDMQQLALQQSGLGIDQAQLGLQQQGNAIKAQDLAAALGFIDQREGIAGETLENQLARLGINEEGVKAQNATQIRGIENRAAAGGSWFSPEKILASKDSNEAMDQALRDLAIQREDANLSGQLTQIGFDEDRQQIGSQQQQLDLANQGITLAGQDLGLAAQGLGISQQQLQAQLAQALAGLGISQGDKIVSLMSGQSQLTGQQAALLQQLADLAWQNMAGSGFSQSLPSRTTPNSSPGGWTPELLEQAQNAQRPSAPIMW